MATKYQQDVELALGKALAREKQLQAKLQYWKEQAGTALKNGLARVAEYEKLDSETSGKIIGLQAKVKRLEEGLAYNENLLEQIYNLFPSCYEDALVALNLPKEVRDRWEKWSKP